jgi:uncharacterized membrane protein
MDRHLCARCAAAARLDDESQSRAARWIARLRDYAQTLPIERLSAAATRGTHQLARHVAQLEIERRTEIEREALIDWRRYDLRLAQGEEVGSW